MFPIPIISTYGNSVIASTIKKLTSSSRNVAILYTNGHLYMRGSNTYNAFGLSGGSRTDWTLCKEDVQDVWCGDTHTVIKLMNGEYWCSGFYRALGYSSSFSEWTKYDKLNDLLTSTGQDVLQIYTGAQGVQVILSDNRLFSIGYNLSYSLLPSSAAASGASVQTFTLSYTGAKKVCTNLNAGMLINTANNLMIIGSSDNYKLGSGNGTLASWTSATLPSGYNYVFDIQEQYRHTLVYAAADSTGTGAHILLAGYNGYNTMGQIPFTTTSAQVYTEGAIATVKTFGSGCLTTSYQGLYTDGVSLYTSGQAGVNIGSSTNKSTGFTAVSFDTPYNNVIDDFCMASDGGLVTFVLSGNFVYAIGAASWLGTDIYSFIKLTSPE